jgi:alpha,alpha-trehalase
MVMLWANRHGIKAALPFLPQLHKEYNFWMRGKDLLDESNSSHQRVVQLPDGTVLNRYWDNFSGPRPESYKEDYELAETFPTDQREQVYRHLRAGAESGWDYSSRWFSDGKSLDSIITTQILPVDLNCLLYFLESSISTLNLYSGDSVQARFFQKLSDNRASAIQNYFWDPKAGYFVDYNIQMGKTTEQFSAAGMVPLYFQVATIEQAQNAIVFLKENLLFPGGVVSTTQNTGQQWDFPNGWAPQQWMTIQGLNNYQHHALADDITSRWLSITERVYSNTGKMMEKYNVIDLSLTAGGGEYTTQDGFGWTNGVTLALWSLQENGSNSNTQ